jgi:hypothetical protein
VRSTSPSPPPRPEAPVLADSPRKRDSPAYVTGWSGGLADPQPLDHARPTPLALLDEESRRHDGRQVASGAERDLQHPPGGLRADLGTAVAEQETVVEVRVTVVPCGVGVPEAPESLSGVLGVHGALPGMKVEGR